MLNGSSVADQLANLVSAVRPVLSEMKNSRTNALNLRLAEERENLLWNLVCVGQN